jgi:hypothetical protein
MESTERIMMPLQKQNTTKCVMLIKEFSCFHEQSKENFFVEVDDAVVVDHVGMPHEHCACQGKD